MSLQTKVMKLQTFYLTYLDLSPSLSNRFSSVTHQTITQNIRSIFFTWDFFLKKYPEYSIGFTVVTKRDWLEFTVKGPSISRKMQIIDYSIFLPDQEYDLNSYIDFVFEGISTALKKYQIEEESLILIRDECKIELNTRNLVHE